MSSDDTEWRQYLIDKLRDRNRKEAGSFTEIISQNNRLLDSVAQLKAEKLKLSVENEQLRTAVSTGGAGKDAAGAQLAIGALEKKLLAQQEELTQLHKRKGENAQMIVDLNIKVEKLQKSLTEKERTIAEQLTANNSLRAEVEMFKNNLEGLKKLNTTLLDEHTALQLAFSALEEKLRGVQNENQLLVERLIRYKAKDADKLNEENETIRRKRKDKVKRELEDAVRDTTSGGQQFTHRNSLSPSQYLDGDDLDNGAIDLTSLAGDIEDTMGLDINTRLSFGYHGQANPTILKLKFEAHDTEAHAVRWSPVERVLATGGADRKVKLWSVGKGGTKEPKAVLGGSSASINSVDFDSTGSYVLGTSNDYGARVWTVSDSRLRHSLTGHSGKVMAAKYIHEPIKVVTGSHDRTLKIWDLRSIACIETKFAGSSCNDLVTTDSLGSIIISGHYDKKIRFWDIRTEKQADDILMPAKITSLDLSKDCNLLMCTVRDDSIRVIDLRKNQVIQTFNHDNFRIASDFARAAFDSTGTKIACGSSDGFIYIWNINGFFETTLEGHGSPVYAVSWSPHSNSLASVGKAKVCIIHSDT